MINRKSCISMLVLTLAVTSISAIAAERGDRTRARAEAGDERVRPDGERPDARRHGLRHRVARIFNALDTDENGVITLDEFIAKPAAKAVKQFDRIDTDDDELISFEEFSVLHNDEPRDSDIDLEELRACIAENSDREVSERPDVASRFNLIDTNGDGYLDVDEFTTAKTNNATEKFYKIDADGDGGISPKELAAALKARRHHRQVRRGCVEEQREVSDLLTE